MAVKKINYNMNVEEECNKHIKNFLFFKESDRQKCIKANKFRVECLNLIPIIHPDI